MNANSRINGKISGPLTFFIIHLQSFCISNRRPHGVSSVDSLFDSPSKSNSAMMAINPWSFFLSGALQKVAIENRLHSCEITLLHSSITSKTFALLHRPRTLNSPTPCSRTFWPPAVTSSTVRNRSCSFHSSSRLP